MIVAIGEEVTRYVFALNKRLTGTVEWIHPEGRYFRVRFDLPGGSFRECYAGPGRVGIALFDSYMEKIGEYWEKVSEDGRDCAGREGKKAKEDHPWRASVRR